MEKKSAATDATRRVKFQENFMKYFSFSAIVILVVLFTVLQNNFLAPANLTNLLRDTAPLMIMAAGMTSVLMLGSIDLSMGSVCSVANVLTVIVLSNYADRFPNPAVAALVALVVALVFGTFSGLVLGLIHVKLKVPSFIASLGFMSVWQSVAYLLTERPEAVPKTMWPAVDWFKISYSIIGLPLILALALVAVLLVFQKFTTFGRALDAIGGNERAARIAGISVDRTKTLVFAINGACAALGGYFLVGKSRSSSPTVGDPFTLLIVASVVLGGTSLSGGRGSVAGTILGVFTVSIIQNGMNFIGVDAYWQSIVFGIFVLAAIAVSVDRRTRGLVIK